MKAGDIVRKKMGDGTPVGSFYQVIGFKNNYQLVKIQSLVSETENMYIRRDRIHVLRQMKMVISHGIFEKIDQGKQISIIHDPTSQWVRMLHDQIEIIQLRDNVYSHKMMLFEVDEIKRTLYRTVSSRSQDSFQIRLNLGNRIL